MRAIMKRMLYWEEICSRCSLGNKQGYHYKECKEYKIEGTLYISIRWSGYLQIYFSERKFDNPIKCLFSQLLHLSSTLNQKAFWINWCWINELSLCNVILLTNLMYLCWGKSSVSWQLLFIFFSIWYNLS